MSKHWNPPRSHVRRRKRKPGFSWGEIRLTLLGGVFLGLAYVLVPLGGPGEIVVKGQGEEVSDPRSARIVDGDTFRYEGETYRIADIDTPEVKGRCPYETELAARATDRMESLLHQGPFELDPVDRDEDRYGRKLRIVTRDGESLGDRLVAEGLARTWSGRREPWC